MTFIIKCSNTFCEAFTKLWKQRGVGEFAIQGKPG